MTDPLDPHGPPAGSDELALLRAANPVPADDPRYADTRPLHHQAERALNQLLHGTRSRRARRTLVLRAEAAVCAVAALLVLGLSYVAAPAATAAPAPLDPGSTAAAVPLGTLADRALRAAADGRPEPRPGTHVRTWTLGAHGERPEERVVRRRPDGSRTERVTRAGTPLPTRTFPPSRSDAPPRSRPPGDTAGLRRYLTALHHGDTRKAPQLMVAASELLDNWTPGARQTAALVRLFAAADGLRPAGPVTDRLGRSGQAYVTVDAATAVCRMLILDPADGTVLGMDVTSADSGELLSYRAWQR
ncbi:CU044_5270 family protein [Streptomyces sp. cg35]|uniref:CU044_5270 family protein n=1 Tax=Streptomyces sp. cg35 TaxID=3421650 RepID=UPI003D178273